MKTVKIISLLLAALLLCGCADNAESIRALSPPEDKQLVIYTSHNENVYQPIIREFEERTGIWVTVVTGGTNDMLIQIRQEQDAPKADLMFGGGADSVDRYQDCFTPYISKNSTSIDPQFLDSDGFWSPFSVLPLVIVCNSKLVDPASISGWSDLDKPELIGRTAFADPSRSGSCFTALSMLDKLLGEDALPRLGAWIDGEQLESSGKILTDVASGHCLTGITLEETALQRIHQGSNLAIIYPKEGTCCVSDCTAIIRNAPHMENARLFLDFTLSCEVQSLLVNSCYRRSVRTDLPGTDLLPPLESLNILDYDSMEAAKASADLLRRWDAIVNGGAA